MYSELPISVPCINPLFVRDNDTMLQDEPNEDQDQFEQDSYITSDEETTEAPGSSLSSTDTETDEVRNR